MNDLRSHRLTLAISQSRLARLSGVSRFKICTYELGDVSLRPEERDRIREALQAEAERLRAIPAGMAFVQFQSATPAGTLSRAEVARSAGITVARLAAIQNGLRQPTTEEFERIVGALSACKTGSKSDSESPESDARPDLLPLANATERP